MGLYMSFLIGANSYGGKSLEQELMVKKYIHEGVFPSWVLDIYSFLQTLNLHFYVCCNKSDDEFRTWFEILYVPKNLWDIILSETKKLNLIFQIDEFERAYYETLHSQKVHFARESVNFKIREANIHENVDEICHTLKRDL